MKKIVTCFLFVCFCAGVFAQSQDFEAVNEYLSIGFSSVLCKYVGEDEVQSSIDSLSLNEKLDLYETHSRSSALYLVLNALCGFGVGSFAQGDISGGVKSAVLDSLGISFITTGFVLTALNMSAMPLYDMSEEDAQRMRATQSYYAGYSYAGLTLMAVGSGFLIGSFISALIRPGVFANKKNAE